MKYNKILQTFSILSLILVSNTVFASEVTGNLSSNGINSNGGTTGTIGGTVVSPGSEVSGTFGNGSLTGNVTGGGGGGGGGGGSIVPPNYSSGGSGGSTNNPGQVLGASTFTPYQGVGGAVYPVRSSGLAQAAVTGEVMVQTSTTTQTTPTTVQPDPTPTQVTNSPYDFFGLSMWFWLFLLILLIIAILIWILGRDDRRR